MSDSNKKSKKQAEDEAAVLEKINEMPEPYDTIGKRVHEIIMESAPELKPRLWYGMPGYAASGPVLIYLRVDDPYMTFGFTEKVSLEPDANASDQLMASAWFFTSLDQATETRLSKIARKVIN
ncbi:MAG: DUF1801 domain-containing protein [Chloroflexota bacterium]